MNHVVFDCTAFITVLRLLSVIPKFKPLLNRSNSTADSVRLERLDTLFTVLRLESNSFWALYILYFYF